MSGAKRKEVRGSMQAVSNTFCYTPPCSRMAASSMPKTRKQQGESCGGGGTVKGTHEAHHSRGAKVVQGFEGILRVRIATPLDFVLDGAIHDALAYNSFNFIGRLAVDGGHGRWAVELAG